MLTSWIILGIGILFEIAGSFCLKLSQGFTKLLPSVLLFVFFGCALACASLAMRKIELSVAYTIWAGVGISAIALVGILYFGESSNPLKIISIALVVIGVVGINLSTKH